MLTIYGISNCDTIKKAKTWLTENNIEYQFHDYKKLNIDAETLRAWSEEFGYENLLNRRGTTWRKLSDSDKADLNESKAIQLMIANTSLIKRPVLESYQRLILGFKPSEYETLL